METIFCNTTEVRKDIEKLFGFQSSDWNNFDGDANTFAELQNKVLPESKYLDGFWEDKVVNDKKFWAWSCLRAFDDTPEKFRIYCGKRNGFRIDHIDKYDVLHDREAYLYDLLATIWGLFHDWQFVTQGFTAY